MSDKSIGRYRFDDAIGALRGEGKPVDLGRRGAALLALLLDRRGEIVTKQALIDAAWPGVAIEDSNLSVQVARLRKLVGPELIETVGRIGYRIGEPSEPHDDEEIRHSKLPTIAILPFEELGQAAQDGTTTDGLVEDLITALSQFKSLGVAARRSSFLYRTADRDLRQVARSLGVRYLVEGSRQRSGGNVRTTAQLIDGVTGTHVWAQNFDGTSEDLVSRAATVARLAATVEARVHSAEVARAARSEDAEAYAWYLRGRQKIRSSRADDNLAGYRFYLKALELEPDNVEFLAAAAEAVHHRIAVGWEQLTGNDKALARAHMRRGIELVDADAASLSLFSMAMMTTGEADLGLANARRAAEINPNSPLVLVVAGLANVWAGDLGEAEASFRRSLELNPTDPTQRFALEGLGKVACIREDFAETLKWSARANAFSHGLSSAHWHLIAASAQLGRMDDARRYLERYAQVSPGVTVARLEAAQPFADRSRFQPLLKGLRLAGMAER